MVFYLPFKTFSLVRRHHPPSVNATNSDLSMALKASLSCQCYETGPPFLKSFLKDSQCLVLPCDRVSNPGAYIHKISCD